MSSHIIEIKKRGSETVGWKVTDAGVTPNTVVSTDLGVTVLLKIEGVTKILAAGSATVHSLMNPGKKTKLIGGNKPYERAEIYAFDQGSSFSGEWGLGGNTAIPCMDTEFGVKSTAVAFGEYKYKVENFIAFFQSMTFNENGEITRDAVRETLRGETVEIIRNVLAAELTAKGMEYCSTHLASFTDEMKEKIDHILGPKGIGVENVSIARLAFDRRHEAKRGVIDDAKLQNEVKRLEHESIKEDLAIANEVAEADRANRRAESQLELEQKRAEAEFEMAQRKAASEIDIAEKKADSEIYVAETKAEADAKVAEAKVLAEMAAATRAPAPAPAPKKSEAPATPAYAKPVAPGIICPRCQEVNYGTNFCGKCGEKLKK